MKKNFMYLDKTVLFTSILICIGMVICFFIFPDMMNDLSGCIFNWIIHNLNWLYIIFSIIVIITLLFLSLSKYGNIRLGKDSDRPEYSNLSWFAMMFSAGMGVGLIFFSVSEPLNHYTSPLYAEAFTPFAAQESIYLTFFHWGIHPWAIYASVALPFAYFRYRKSTPALVSACIQPLFPNFRLNCFYSFIDTLTVLITLMGISISFGLGALQITSGINYVFNVDDTVIITFVIIIIGTILFMFSSCIGIENGMKKISNFNIKLSISLMLFVFILSSPIDLIKILIEGIGSYLSHFLDQSFFLNAHHTNSSLWLENWTIFYWALWILWAPFVGIFIAQISKGRTIREFVAVVLLIPTLFSCIWFSIMGGSALNISQSGNTEIIDAVAQNSASGIFSLMHTFPLYKVSSLLILISLAIFFTTSADSATQVLITMSSKGQSLQFKPIRILWSLLIGVFSYTFIISGGIDSMNRLSVIFTLPYIIIIFLLLISLIKSLRNSY